MSTTASLGDRQRRLAHNQSVFREVNERIEELTQTFRETRELPSFVCECANTDCTERVSMEISRYESLRANPTQFLVVSGKGHVFPEAEHVIERTDDFWIVEKIERAADESARLDPRDGDSAEA